MSRVESISGKRRIWKPSRSILNWSTKKPLLPMLNHWAGSQRLQQTGSLCAGPLLPRLGLSIVCSDQICRGFTASGPFVVHSFRAQSATKCSVCLVCSDEACWVHSIYLVSMRGATLFLALPMKSSPCHHCQPATAADGGTALDGLHTKCTRQHRTSHTLTSQCTQANQPTTKQFTWRLARPTVCNSL